MRTFYIFDMNNYLVCIIHANKFLRVKGASGNIVLIFYDLNDNPIAFFHDPIFIIRDNPDITRI